MPDGRETVYSKLNNQNDGNTYSINYWQNAYIISRGGKQTKKPTPTRYMSRKIWNHEEIVYEEIFDSYALWIWRPSRRNLNARLSEFNENETAMSIT